MAKKKAKAAIPDPQPEQKAPVEPAPKVTLEALAADVAELKGDLIRLAREIGHTFGEPLAGKAEEIATKHQGPA